MNEGINTLYFGGNIQYKPYGYYFHSKHSKTKDKHVILNFDDCDVKKTYGEIIHNKKFSQSLASYEIVYDFENVFERDFYKNQKQYQNRIKNPSKLASKLGLVVDIMSVDDYDEIKKLHDDWCDHKLADPRTHRITFSKKRYINCVTNSPKVKGAEVLVVKKDGMVYGVRVIVKTNECIFDAANFCAYWEISQLSESINFITLQYIKEKNNVRYFNTGLAAGTLKKYKQHFPNIEYKVYRKVSKPEIQTESLFNLL